MYGPIQLRRFAGYVFGLIAVFGIGGCQQEDAKTPPGAQQDAPSLDEPVTRAAPEEIKKIFKQHFPALSFDEVNESPVPGIMQVNAGPVIFYSTPDGKFALMGDIIELKDTAVNLTELSRKQARLKALAQISNDQMIEFAPEESKYTITVFTDTDCAYCRKLHSQINELNQMGITVRYLSFPRQGTQSDSFKVAQSVWCAEDKKAAMDLAKSGKDVEEKKCTSMKLEEQMNLALLMGARGTPTIVLEDGTLIPGYLPPERLLKLTEQAKQLNLQAAKALAQETTE